MYQVCHVIVFCQLIGELEIEVDDDVFEAMEGGHPQSVVYQRSHTPKAEAKPTVSDLQMTLNHHQMSPLWLVGVQRVQDGDSGMLLVNYLKLRQTG